MARKGILLDEKNDLLTQPGRDENGLIISGVVIGDSDLQNMELIVKSAKGEFKEYPVLGVSPEEYIKSVGREKELIREVTVQLEMDGYNPKVAFENGNLKIEI